MADEERRDPFAHEPSPEPVNDGELVRDALGRAAEEAVARAGGLAGRGGTLRKTRVRPAEKRRRGRQLSITFSEENADAPDRLRALAARWGLVGPDGRRPNVSAIVERLLIPRLEAAEQGEVEPPKTGGEGNGTERPQRAS